MRPAGKGPLDSLYFDYPRFAARRVPELDGATARHPVLIVGAGPIGMTAALVLARYGITQRADRSQGHVQRRQPRHLHRAPEHAYPGADRRGRAIPRQGARLAARPQLLPRRTDFPAGNAASGQREIPADVQSAAAVHREIPARCGRSEQPDRHALAERTCRHRAYTRTAYPRALHRRTATIGSTPSMCWPPTARARRSARCWGCG